MTLPDFRAAVERPRDRSRTCSLFAKKRSIPDILKKKSLLLGSGLLHTPVPSDAACRGLVKHTLREFFRETGAVLVLTIYPLRRRSKPVLLAPAACRSFSSTIGMQMLPGAEQNHISSNSNRSRGSAHVRFLTRPHTRAGFHPHPGMEISVSGPLRGPTSLG